MRSSSSRQGPIRRLPSDMGSWRPVRFAGNLVTAPTEGATASGTANGGSTTTLTLATSPWTASQWIGALCTMTGGSQSGKVGRVSTNAVNSLTFADAFAGAIANGDTFTLQSGIRAQIEHGTSSTPSTLLMTQPASDTTTENRLVLAPTVIEATVSTFVTAAIAADSRCELLIHGIGASAGAEGTDLSLVLDLEQTDS